MTNITYVLEDGQQVTIDGPDGLSVMEIAVRNGLAGILAECGGSCMCATCHVYVLDDPGDSALTRSEGEEAMLEEAVDEVKPTSRLSCQIKLYPALSGLVVQVARNS